ncbi:hypothetical protein XHV734_0971 [Xanthomonas hortorum pv. vitians]|nr:hypothetical protein XHV734_0971 [Xanthomonas hortorum pv. vitians]
MKVTTASPRTLTPTPLPWGEGLAIAYLKVRVE